MPFESVSDFEYRASDFSVKTPSRELIFFSVEMAG